MKNFEDIVRERILLSTLRDVPPDLHLDKNDVEIFASMIYALLRAGARREGQQGFHEAFAHFAGNRGNVAAYRNDEELEIMRGALLAAVDRFATEAHALHIYFNSLEHDGMTERDATARALEAME